MMTKFHHFSMLMPSPWPVFCSLAAFNFFFSSLMFLKFSLLTPFTGALGVVSCACFLWWISYSNEMNLEGGVSFSIDSGVKMSMILFISSEVFFFFSFFWSYFHFFLSPSMEAGLCWPPIYLEMFDYSNVPLVNTLVLLSSGMTMTMAHHFLLASRTDLCAISLLLTVSLGILFSYLQWMEYCSSFFGLGDSTFGTAFFMLTGFHGIHVAIGTLFICVSMIRIIHVSGASTNCTSMEMAAWYWHFVDVVWIFLYYFIYYMNN